MQAAFRAAGRPLNATSEPELFMPGAVWISRSTSPSAQDVRQYTNSLVPGRVGYLVHVGELRTDASSAVDRLRVGGRPVVTIPVRALQAAHTDGRVAGYLAELEQTSGTKDNLFDTKNALVRP